MGVGTRGILHRGINVFDVKAVVQEIIQGDVRVHDNGHIFKMLTFEYKGIERNLSFFENYRSKTLNGEVITLCVIGQCGQANEILKTIVSHFGGLYIADASSGDKPIYLEKDTKHTKNSVTEVDKEFLDLLRGFTK